jgi:hypothetical protein
VRAKNIALIGSKIDDIEIVDIVFKQFSNRKRTYFLCKDTAGKKIVVDYSGTVCYTSEDYDALQTALKSIRMETDEIIIFCENGYENALAEKVSGKLQFRSVGV